MKEAGWGDGFRIVLAATNDRYPNDAAIAQTIAQMWTKLGLKAEVEAIPVVFFRSRQQTGLQRFAAPYGSEEAGSGIRALIDARSCNRRWHRQPHATATARSTHWRARR